MNNNPTETSSDDDTDAALPISISGEKGKFEVEIVEGYLNGVWASNNFEVRERLFSEIATIAIRGKRDLKSGDEITIIKAVELVREIAPQDTIEALLASQMLAVHTAMIDLSNRLARNQSLEMFKSYESAMNRLARTFTAQVEALNRHRRKGTQKVVVQHVNVNEGGQAIVGDVNTKGRGT